MKRFFKYQIICILFGWITLSGFTKIAEWGKRTFYQAPVYGDNFIQGAQPFIKSVQAYSQFTSVATFDVMLLTDALRMLFVDYHKKNNGISADQEKLLRQRQLNENRYFISIYVLASQQERSFVSGKAMFCGEYQKAGELLSGKDPMWNVRLIVGGRQITPESVRVVDLPVEYRHLFGEAFNQFSTIYQIKFHAYDSNNQYILPFDRPTSMIFRFSSPMRQLDVIWNSVSYYLQ